MWQYVPLLIGTVHKAVHAGVVLFLCMLYQIMCNVYNPPVDLTSSSRFRDADILEHDHMAV